MANINSANREPWEWQPLANRTAPTKFEMELKWRLGEPVGILSVETGTFTEMDEHMIVLLASIVAMGPELGGETDVLVVAFAAPLSFGFAVAVLTERLASLRPIERVAPIAFGSTVGLLPIMATQPFDASIPSSLSTWVLALGIALFTAIGPQWMYSSAAPRVGPARAAVAGSVAHEMLNSDSRYAPYLSALTERSRKQSWHMLWWSAEEVAQLTGTSAHRECLKIRDEVTEVSTTKWARSSRSRTARSPT